MRPRLLGGGGAPREKIAPAGHSRALCEEYAPAGPVWDVAQIIRARWALHGPSGRVNFATPPSGRDFFAGHTSGCGFFAEQPGERGLHREPWQETLRAHILREPRRENPACSVSPRYGSTARCYRGGPTGRRFLAKLGKRTVLTLFCDVQTTGHNARREGVGSLAQRTSTRFSTNGATHPDPSAYGSSSLGNFVETPLPLEAA